jgi:hypothetical protein
VLLRIVVGAKKEEREGEIEVDVIHMSEQLARLR